MKVKNAKQKGRRLQKWVADQIGRVLNLPVGKDAHIEGREMGQSGPDIKLSPLAREGFPFSVECQNAETWTLGAKIAQAQTNIYPEHDKHAWLCVFKKNGGRPVVVMDAEKFFNLLIGEE